MQEYKIDFHPAAKKELDKLDYQTKVYVIKSLSLFIEAYSPEYKLELMHQSRIKKLKGEWKGFYRLRLRNYHIIYEKIQEKLIIYIIRVAHKREAY